MGLANGQDMNGLRIRVHVGAPTVGGMDEDSTNTPLGDNP